MAKSNVIWTQTADIQFVGILEYWIKRNKPNTYSKKLVKLVSQRTKRSANKPLIYKVTDFKDVRVASMERVISAFIIKLPTKKLSLQLFGIFFQKSFGNIYLPGILNGYFLIPYSLSMFHPLDTIKFKNILIHKLLVWKKNKK